jgi:tetratricopeptide (TPR) repeat protein
MRGRLGAISAVIAVIFLFALLAGCSQTAQQREEAHIDKGKQYLAGKQYRKAWIEFRVAAQNMPKDALPVYLLGMTYLSGGAYRSAAEAFQKAVTMNPKLEAAQYQLALFKVGTTKPELLNEAKQVLSGWTVNHPKDAEAFAALGFVDAKLGNRDEAIRMLETAGAKDGATIRVASAVVAVYAARGDGNSVKEVAATLARKLPHSPEAAVLNAEVSLAARDTATGDAEINRALALKSDFRPALQLRLRREVAMDDTLRAEQTALALSRLPQGDLWGTYARQLFSEKKIDQGIAEFERQLKVHNNDVLVRNDYASALLTAGRRKEAEAVVGATLEKHPSDVTALLLRTILEIDRGSLDAASRDIQKLRKLQVSAAQVSFQESRIFAARGETFREGDLLADALKSDPGMLAARLELAHILSVSGKGRNAIAILDETPAPQKRSAEFMLNRNMALLAAGEWKEARQSVDKALSVARLPGFLYQDAVLRVQDNDLSGAQRSLEEAFHRAPSNTPILRMLGDIMRRQGEFPQFLGMVKDAVAKNAGSAPLQTALGGLLAGEGDKAGARAAFEAAKAAGATVDPEIEIALLDLRAGAVDNAHERLLNLVKEHDSARARQVLAEIEMRSGSGDGPVRHYLKALEMEPSNAIVMNNLAGYLALHQKKYDDALFWGQKALALAPDSPIVEDTVGWTYYLQGKYSLAEPFLEKSAKAADRPAAHYHLAAVLAKMGDIARGRKEYEQALSQDAQSPERPMVAALYGNPLPEQDKKK